jgi:hypothetical protein
MRDYCYDDYFNTVIGVLEDISNKLSEIHEISMFSFNSMAQSRNGDIDNNIERLKSDLKLLKKAKKQHEQRQKEFDTRGY